MVVEIPAELEKKIEEWAAHLKISKEELVIRAIRGKLGLSDKPWNREDALKAVEKMFELNAPTCDIDQMLAEIEGRRP
jgi:predicted glycosyltransferase